MFANDLVYYSTLKTTCDKNVDNFTLHLKDKYFDWLPFFCRPFS